MQRLFSTFANGWPGKGLFLQRLLIAAVLFHLAVTRIGSPSSIASAFPQMIAAVIGVLLLVGLWTPVAGMLVTAFEVWIAIFCVGNPLVPIMLATLAATLSMIGPGAWSVDARLFGRKRIEPPKR